MENSGLYIESLRRWVAAGQHSDIGMEKHTSILNSLPDASERKLLLCAFIGSGRTAVANFRPLLNEVCACLFQYRYRAPIWLLFFCLIRFPNAPLALFFFYHLSSWWILTREMMYRSVLFFASSLLNGSVPESWIPNIGSVVTMPIHTLVSVKMQIYSQGGGICTDLVSFRTLDNHLPPNSASKHLKQDANTWKHSPHFLKQGELESDGQIRKCTHLEQENKYATWLENTFSKATYVYPSSALMNMGVAPILS